MQVLTLNDDLALQHHIYGHHPARKCNRWWGLYRRKVCSPMGIGNIHRKWYNLCN